MSQVQSICSYPTQYNGPQTLHNYAPKQARIIKAPFWRPYMNRPVSSALELHPTHSSPMMPRGRLGDRCAAREFRVLGLRVLGLGF